MKTHYRLDGRPLTDGTGSAPWNAWTLALAMPADHVSRIPWFRIVRQSTDHEAIKVAYAEMVEAYGYGNVRMFYLDPEMATGELGKHGGGK